ncbi:MAG: response regulator transcription factor [Clostridia bacterium]|nr:response regulator transcription factor [Clostridia bacterium]
MNWITVKQASEKWGVTPRRVQELCKEDKIKGAMRWERTWMIPSYAVLPSSSKGENPSMPMPKKSPFLDMTSLYNKAGEADKIAELLVNNPEAKALFEAQIAYRRGEIDKVYDKARYFLNSHSGFYAILSGGLILSQVAMWRGDVKLWYEAKRHIFEVPCKTQGDREIVSLALAIIDSSVYDNKDYPEWFKRGNFESLPADAHPATKVYYAKYLHIVAFAIASKQTELEGIQGLALMKMLPNTIEPMITQAVVDKTVIPEIFLRLSCAVAYHYSGEKASAIEHIDKAIKLALADGLYGILVEYMRHFDSLFEERLALADENAVIIIKELYSTYSIGWAKLSSAVRNRYIATNLLPREREVAKLVAFGFTSKEIANMLYVSESTVKQTVQKIVQKTGVKDRSEFSDIL